MWISRGRAGEGERGACGGAGRCGVVLPGGGAAAGTRERERGEDGGSRGAEGYE